MLEDQIEEVFNLIESIDCNTKEGKLEVGRYAIILKEKGFSRIEFSKRAGINESTVKDWSFAYEAYVSLPESEREKYTITQLKRIDQDRRKKSGKMYSGSMYKSKAKIKGEIDALYDIYFKLRRGRFDTDTIKKITYMTGLIMAESKGHLGISNEIDRLEPDDIPEVYNDATLDEKEALKNIVY